MGHFMTQTHQIAHFMTCAEKRCEDEKPTLSYYFLIMKGHVIFGLEGIIIDAHVCFLRRTTTSIINILFQNQYAI